MNEVDRRKAIFERIKSIPVIRNDYDDHAMRFYVGHIDLQIERIKNRADWLGGEGVKRHREIYRELESITGRLDKLIRMKNVDNMLSSFKLRFQNENVDELTTGELMRALSIRLGFSLEHISERNITQNKERMGFLPLFIEKKHLIEILLVFEEFGFETEDSARKAVNRFIDDLKKRNVSEFNAVQRGHQNRRDGVKNRGQISQN